MGAWQHHFGFAESRHKYEELKARLETLKQIGRPNDPAAALDWDRSLSGVRSDFVQMNIPSDDSSRMMWEQRLYSVEPIALFALANTLAGILIVAVILWLGLMITNARRLNRPTMVVAAIVTLLIVYCVLLTKSRTAWVGLTVGLASWGLSSGAMRTPSRPRLTRGLMAGFVAVIVLVALAYASGGLDRFVVSESAKSLRYRFEYWTASWRMLEKSARNLVLGVGPGNFRQNYLEFKLPQSSEEIADPHDMVLDVWANGGLTALVGLAGVCFCAVRPFFPNVNGNSLETIPEAAANADAATQKPRAAFATPTKLWSDGVILGGAMGYLVILFLGLADDVTMVLLLPAWLLIVLVCRPVFQGELPRVVAASASLVLMVHLAGAGGIGMPGVSQVLLFVAMLAAPGAAAADFESGDPAMPRRDSCGPARTAAGWTFHSDSQLPVAVIGVVGLALYLACWFTGLMPIVTVRSLIASAKEAMFERGQPSQAERDFRIAAEFDTWSATACERLSEIAFQSWLGAERDRPDVFEPLREVAIDGDRERPAESGRIPRPGRDLHVESDPRG